MRNKICQVMVILFVILFPLGIWAQEEVEKINNVFQGTRVVNGQSVNLADDGVLLLMIQHRFGDINGGFYDLFGLDVASMRLGFEYGLGKNLNLGIGRSTWLKTFDTFAKFRLVQQKSDFPFTAVVSAGASLPTDRNYFPSSNDQFSDKLSWNFQLLMATSIDNFAIHLSPGFLQTGYIPALNRDLSVFTLGSAAALRVSKKVSVNLEYLVPFSSDISGDNALSMGVDIETKGHLFQLVLSNNQRMFHQAVYTNTTGSLSGGHLFFGFNLVRKFELKYKDMWTD